jgi:hypothetical protein
MQNGGEARWTRTLTRIPCRVSIKPGEPEGPGQAEFSLVLLARDEHGLLGHLYPGQGLLVDAAGEWGGNPTQSSRQLIINLTSSD